jgi:hypothetical protein
VNFLKIDVEGREPLVLKGALRSFERGIVDAVYVKLSDGNLVRSGYRPDQCLSILNGAGFDLFYCKSVDFETGVVKESETLQVEINGIPLKLARVTSFPPDHQTDILAIHSGLQVMS